MTTVTAIRGALNPRLWESAVIGVMVGIAGSLQSGSVSYGDNYGGIAGFGDRGRKAAGKMTMLTGISADAARWAFIVEWSDGCR